MSTGKRLGYRRVSSADQHPDRQLAGVPVDRMFTDYASGKDSGRPELLHLLSYARDGDTVLVHSLDRLARNLDDLRRLVADLTAQGVRVEFLQEGLVFTGDDAPMSRLLLSVLGAFAEFERALIRERQREGITIARDRGTYKGRKPRLDGAQQKELLSRLQVGERPSDLAREYKISRSTIRSYLVRAGLKRTAHLIPDEDLQAHAPAAAPVVPAQAQQPRGKP